jgi:hypothetical protein
VAGYCESVGSPSWATGGFWETDFRSNLDRQMCQQITSIRSEYQAVISREALAGRLNSQAAISARSILLTVDAIDEQLEAGETCLTLGRATPPELFVGFGLHAIAYRIATGMWTLPAATDVAYRAVCTDWSNGLIQLNSDLEQQLAWANDTRAETVGGLVDQAKSIGESATTVTNVGPDTWCENAPEVCSAVKTAGWLLVAYIGFQAFKELK